VRLVESFGLREVRVLGDTGAAGSVWFVSFYGLNACWKRPAGLMFWFLAVSR
jgi:hypothetical protein